MTHTTEINEHQVNDFITEFCPFGYLDCKAAVQTAYHAGYGAKWAAEQVQNFCDETGSKIDDVDPVYCVYDSILQEARNEIDQETNFDIQNDASFEVYGNFMCTDYDYNEESKEALINVLAEHEIIIENLSEATQYFLDQVEITQEDINNAKKEETE